MNSQAITSLLTTQFTATLSLQEVYPVFYISRRFYRNKLYINTFSTFVTAFATKTVCKFSAQHK
jgi:hypothetical protein